MTTSKKMHIISLGERLGVKDENNHPVKGQRILVSKNNEPPFVQDSSQKNREVLRLHLDRGDITFNFAPKSRAYTELKQKDPNRPSVLIYNSSNINYFGILDRRIALGTIKAFDLENKISGYSDMINNIFGNTPLAYITFSQEGPFDKIRLYHDKKRYNKEDYKVEFGYTKGSLRGKVSIFTIPTLEEYLSDFMTDIPDASQDFISLKEF